MFLTCCACQGQQQQSDNSTSENTSTADAAPSQETEKVPASIEDELSPVLTEADKANIPIEMARNNIDFGLYQIKDGWITVQPQMRETENFTLLNVVWKIVHGLP